MIGQAGFAGYGGSTTVPAGGEVPAAGETPGQGQGRHLLHRLSGTPGLSSVLLHNGGFCNGCMTKLFLHKSRNVSYNDIVSQLIDDKR